MPEILIVLCFLTMSLAIVLPNQHLTYSGLSEKRVIDQFTDNMHYIQQLSVQKGIVHTVYIDTSNNFYQMYKDWNSSILMTEEFPPDWEIELTSLKPYTSFNRNGTVNNPGTMWIHTNQKTYKIIFPFGRNGVVVHQQ
ncbi:hypothetical protein [Salimicrobium flavidum]|nr:hypothetical protein [Salimicrobium flavidum]